MFEKVKSCFFVFFENDEIVWVYEVNRKFFVKFIYRNLMNLRLLSCNRLVKGVWKGFVLLKVEIFGWVVLFGRLNIRGRLLELRCIV